MAKRKKSAMKKVASNVTVTTANGKKVKCKAQTEMKTKDGTMTGFVGCYPVDQKPAKKAAKKAAKKSPAKKKPAKKAAKKSPAKKKPAKKAAKKSPAKKKPAKKAAKKSRK